jgi:endonuclease YncB( thermonuclease family)
MNKEKIVITCISIIGLFGYFIMSLTFLPIQEVDGRCPNGYHKSPSGDCEEVTDTKGMPRCPNGYHRSPDGDCEKVSKVSSERSVDIDDDDDDSDDNIDFTKTNKEKSKFDEDNSPLNQIFNSNNNEQSNKEVNDDNSNYKDNIELEGKVTYVIDGDTLDINDIRIRLSLVDTPERGQDGYQEAKNFVKDLCLKKEGQVDVDDGQRRGDRYGRDIGIVYCDGINLNAALMENNLARIYMEYCDISEFSNGKWAKSYS